MKISILEKDDRLLVTIPYALKDSFKAVFRTATWAAAHKAWSVSTRSRKRLEAWVAEVERSGVLEPAEDHDAREMAEQEVEKLRVDLGKLDMDLRRQLAEQRSLEEIRADNAQLLDRIARMRAELANTVAAVAEQRQAAAAEKADIEATIASIINLNAVNSAIRSIRWLAAQAPRAQHRHDFEQHVELIDAEHDKLLEAGFDSPLLRELSCANYNRKHKDAHEWQQPLTFCVLAKKEEEEEE